MIQVDRYAFIQIFGVNHKLVVVTRGSGHPAIELYGSRHHKAVVVVRMFADQVHSSRRTKHSRHIPEALLEPLR